MRQRRLPTLGETIRGLRLGFAWSAEYQCFVRISGDGPFRIQVEPAALPGFLRANQEKHYVWWSDDKLDLSKIKPFPAIARARRRADFLVDGHGRRLAGR